MKDFVEEIVAEKVVDTIEIITPKNEKLVEKKKDREKITKVIKMPKAYQGLMKCPIPFGTKNLASKSLYDCI